MRTIYQAENLIDAHLVKNALAQAGIDAYIAGEHLLGGIGQLPVFGLVSVMVADHDELPALPIVAEIDAMLRDPATRADPSLPAAWLIA